MKELLPLLKKLTNTSVRFNELVKNCFTVKTAGDGKTLLIRTLPDQEIAHNLQRKCNEVRFGLPATYLYEGIVGELEKLVEEYPEKTTVDYVNRFFIHKDLRMGDNSDYYCSDDNIYNGLLWNHIGWRPKDCDAG